jgi:hypothetical protein
MITFPLLVLALAVWAAPVWNAPEPELVAARRRKRWIAAGLVVLAAVLP